MTGWLLDTNVLSELRRPRPDAKVTQFLSWRLLVEEGRKAGHTFAQPDLIIAATALHHGLTVVSRNTGDFEKANVPVLNPWST